MCGQNVCGEMVRMSAMSLAGSSLHRTLVIVAIVVLTLLIFTMSPGGQEPVQQTVANSVVRASRVGRRLQKSNKAKPNTIETVERFCHRFDFSGFTFTDMGRSHELTHPMTTCQIHSFSPYVEREAAKRFVDPVHDQLYYANSPAVLWYHGEIVLVSRVWLDREIYEAKDNWPANHFADNWLYTQRFDGRMKPLSNGSIVGIPAPKQWWVGDGPIEPRLFACQDHLFVTFNAAMAFHQKDYMDYTIMWDLNENRPIIPKIKGGSPMRNTTTNNEMPRDKHWMALIENDELFFVHNLDPLRVMNCSLSGDCQFIHEDQNKAGFIFEHSVSHLRGGTPFEVWKWPYYISIAHATLYKENNNHRYYTSHMIVLCVKPYRIVYVSNDIKINPIIYQTTPMVRKKYIDDGFIFPVGLIIEDQDTLSIGVHVNDYSSIIVRMRGVEALMNNIIEVDQQDNPQHGPPVGYLQNHIHETMENTLHIKFVHPEGKIGN